MNGPLLFALQLLAVSPAPSPDPQPATYDGRANQLAIVTPRMDAEVTIDGRLDEAPWARAARLTGFSQYAPVDGLPAEDSTVVLVWYSPAAIHFGVRAYERHGVVNANLSERDRILSDDYVQFLVGTFGDGRQATVFGVNPLGIQLDGTLVEGTARGRTSAFGTEQSRDAADLAPDFTFQSKGRVTPWGYEVEVRIPFKSLRYQAGAEQRWGLNVVRRVQHSGAEDSWAPAKRAAASFLAQSGTLTGLTELRRGLVLDLNPVVTTRATGAAAPSGEWRYDTDRPAVGGNVRWGVTNNLTLNATANPDFSQVESDEGQYAFDPRQALFFAERRPFFLEGNELFATPGNLVYTRRVLKPLAAAKLTGKVAGTTLALLSAIDDPTASLWYDPSRRTGGHNPLFTIARVQRDLGAQSRLGVTVTDREDGTLFNRVGSVDGKLVLGTIYTGAFQLAASTTRGPAASGTESLDGPLWSASLARSGRSFGFTYSVRGVSPEFRTQSGFINRGNVAQASARHRFTRNGARGAMLQALSFDPVVDFLWSYDRFVQRGDALEKKYHLNTNATFRGGWTAGAALLLETFGYDPALYRDVRVVRAPGDTVPFTGVPRLFNRDWLVSFGTPEFKTFSADGFFLYGQDENFYEWSSGVITWATVNANWRPTEQFRAALSYNRQVVDRKSDGSNVAQSSIPRLKLEYQLTRAISVRAIGEYATLRQDALRDDSRTNGPLLAEGAAGWRAMPASERRQFRGDALFAWQPTPGTVFFAGYGSTYYGQGIGDPQLRPSLARERDLRRAGDAVFVKLSYLFRL